MSEFFNRDFSLIFGTRRISTRAGSDTAKPTLRVTFRIQRDTSRDPNTAQVTITNLTEEHRAAIQEKNIPSIIEAGYVNNTSRLFSGNLTFASHERESTDWVSALELGDGSQALQSARINESFGPGTKTATIIKRIVECSGLGIGNVLDELSKGNFRGAVTEFKKGYTASGKCADVLKELTESSGLNFSVQDGQVQLLRVGESNGDSVIVLSSATGLIGSPQIGEDGVVQARSLLQGKLTPGRAVQIKSQQIDSGFFRIQKTVHIGDTSGNDWYTGIEATPL